VNFSCNNVHQFDLVRDIAPCSTCAWYPSARHKPTSCQSAQSRCAFTGGQSTHLSAVSRAADLRRDVRRPALRRPRRLPQPPVPERVEVRAWGAGWQPHKRLDVAHAKAALALIEDEKLDGVRRLLTKRLGRGSHHSPREAINPPGKGVFTPDLAKAKSPRRRLEARSPCRRLEARSPCRRLEARSPRRRLEARSPRRRLEARSPCRRLEAGSPRRRLEARSPRRKSPRPSGRRLIRRPLVAHACSRRSSLRCSRRAA